MRRTISTITDKGYFREEPPEQEDELRLQEILETRKFPGTDTDTMFYAGKGTLSEQFRGDEATLDRLVAKARSLGYNPNPNDFYNPSLASEFADPLAFVPPGGGRSHVKKVCRLRDQDCEEPDGKVINRRSRYSEPVRKPVRMADSIVNDLVKQKIADNPDLRTKSKSELRNIVIEQHGAKG